MLRSPYDDWPSHMSKADDHWQGVDRYDMRSPLEDGSPNLRAIRLLLGIVAVVLIGLASTV